jgi:erythromycin esterase-like protein
LIQDLAHPLVNGQPKYDPLLKFIGDARLVLLGSQTHGTHEFYRERAEITKRLIQEKGFNLVGIEADWPDAYRVNRYVRGISFESDSSAALDGFRVFPSWIWRNADMIDFIGWLKSWNDTMSAQKEKVGFYGIDLYSLRKSIQGVITFLEAIDPAAAQQARETYRCFENGGTMSHRYGFSATWESPKRARKKR